MMADKGLTEEKPKKKKKTLLKKKKKTTNNKYKIKFIKYKFPFSK